MRQPTPSLQREFDLVDADGRWRIELIDGPCVELTCGLFAMSILVMLYTLYERTRVNRCIRIQLRGSRNIADKLEEPAQTGWRRVGPAVPLLGSLSVSLHRLSLHIARTRVKEPTT